MSVTLPTDYLHDVFISYTRSDVITPWVIKYLYPQLKSYMDQNLGGQRAKIYMDQLNIEGGERWPQALRDALLTSKCLVPVLSGEYFSRPWCLSEWKNFVDREKMLGLDITSESLIIPVVWNDGEWFLEEVEQYQLKFDFKNCRSSSPYFEKSDKYFVFEEKIESLAEAVARKVREAPEFNHRWPTVEFDPNKPTVPLKTLT